MSRSDPTQVEQWRRRQFLAGRRHLKVWLSLDVYIALQTLRIRTGRNVSHLTEDLLRRGLENYQPPRTE